MYLCRQVNAISYEYDVPTGVNLVPNFLHVTRTWPCSREPAAQRAPVRAPEAGAASRLAERSHQAGSQRLLLI
eukprot:SAG31_NODE_2320_length_5943_cov_2.466975_6_plen_73_part_00